MKNRIWIYILMTLAFVLIVTNSCKKDEPIITKQKVTGHVQKGPYIIGTTITMSELKSTMEQTGKIFTTQISNNSGSFEFNNVGLSSNYVEFSASGYYFDEVKGDISTSPLNLNALADITNTSTVNVNILTHLEKLRVEYLIKQGKTFLEAKTIAQGEVLGIFGFSLSERNNSETLDISVNSDENAILLAISIILQGDRSVGDLTELLANITNNIREDGLLNSESIMTSLRNSTKELVLTTIRSNLVKRYQDLGIDVSIPNFEKYVNIFLEFSGQKPYTTTQPATNTTTTSVKLNGMVNANSLNTIVAFEYGVTTSYGNIVTATQSPINGSFNTNVNANLTGLLPGSTYHFRLKTENAKGISYGDDLTFTTLGQIPTATSQTATSIQTNAATINGLVNPNHLSTIAVFEWGTTTSYGNVVTAAQSPINGSFNTNVNANLTGLLPGSTYHFRVKADNSLGASHGNDLIFTTLGQKPTATTLAANAGSASAILNGTVNANDLETMVTFEYGTTDNYGNEVNAVQTILTGNNNCNVNTSITGLTLGTTYFYRVKAVNSLGTSYGVNMQFKTAYNIGENVNGGLVFYIDATGQHGLVCATADQARIAWWNGSYLSCSTGTAVGTGQANTISIVNTQGIGSYAAQLCNDLVLNGYSDWFLPSIDELGLMHTNLKLKGLGGFYMDYWSSSENGSNCALVYAMGAKSTFCLDKKEKPNVRAVRAF